MQIDSLVIHIKGFDIYQIKNLDAYRYVSNGAQARYDTTNIFLEK